MEKRVLTLSLLALTVSQANANENGKFVTDSGVTLAPQLVSSILHDDNIYSSGTDQISSNILTIQPSLAIGLEDGLNVYGINFSMKQGLYEYDSNDNYLDSKFDFLTHVESSSRSRFDIKGGKTWNTEPRGTGLSEGSGNAIDDPVRFSTDALFLQYEYGAKTAQGRVAVRGSYRDKNYLNFKDISKYRNISNTLVGTKLIYNPQTGNELFVDVSYDSIKYDYVRINEAHKDSHDTRVLMGIDLQATALTSGSFKLGYQKKDFTRSERKNFSGLSWEGQLNWQPLSYTLFALITSKAAIDPLTEGDYMKQTRHTAFWQHKWSDLLSSTVSLNYSNEIYAGVSRKDTTNSFRVEASYQMLRWLKSTFSVDMMDKESTNQSLEHDKSVIGINFEMTL